jgi:DNA-binding NarL/FixJ family response regulator
MTDRDDMLVGELLRRAHDTDPDIVAVDIDAGLAELRYRHATMLVDGRTGEPSDGPSRDPDGSGAVAAVDVQADGFLRVMVADGRALVREGLVLLLRGTPGVQVVAQAGDSDGAIRLASTTRPDVVLLDAELPYVPVETMIGSLQRVAAGIRVLVLTMHDDPILVQQVLATGAHGLLLKTATSRELLSAIHAVGYAGRTVISQAGDVDADLPLRGPALLSPRERQVLTLAGQALSNAQIGARLSVTESTVKRHLTSIYAKLGAASRLDAVNKAVAARLIDPAHRPAPKVTS